jgi:NAD(P)-dependent dehydrogenase (short-subunit alcohol dehydrogenase family)
MRRLLDGRTAVVTGGTSGLGRAISLTFAEHGANVVVADVETDPRGGGVPTHRRIETETDARAAHVHCDVTDPDDHEAAMDAADSLGGIDVMVNNAGIYFLEPFLDVTEGEFDRMMAVNQKGVFFGARAAIGRMLAAEGDEGDEESENENENERSGVVLNVSSIAGVTGFSNSSVYSMSKAAVKLLSYSLAAEFGPEGIRVNAIHPGTIETRMTIEDEPHLGSAEARAATREEIALRRIGTPEDVAEVALFLASDLGDYVNGESIAVDGGMVNLG